ncbi:MAG: uracil-DNA glycosylase family protein [Sphaerochaetaceae bacterium]|nr:uracil-DNA glycosylase family protein [Sphaerochaetaceae bacterium]
MNRFQDALTGRTHQFSRQCRSIDFEDNMFVYHPLEYAWDLHRQYLMRYVGYQPRVLLLGMNPGPFGMAQTGVPFGEVSSVKEYLKISGDLSDLPETHPKRPIQGLSCQRSEVSGRRLWGFLRNRYPDPVALAKEVAVMNYCPVVFVDKGATGKNITPDKLSVSSKRALEQICDSYLDDILELIDPSFIVGVGKYAQKKLQQSIKRLGSPREVYSILHPSPANPQANRNWEEKVSDALRDAGIFREEM